MINLKNNEHWDMYVKRHSKGVVELSERYINGEITDEKFLEKYIALGPKHPPSVAKSQLRFFKKYFIK